MNGLVAIFVLSMISTCTRAAPTPQQFYPGAAYMYPLYSYYYGGHQAYPYDPYPNAFPHLDYVPSFLSLNSTDLNKLEADFKAAIENLRKLQAAAKAEEKVDKKTGDSANGADPFNGNGKSGNDVGKKDSGAKSTDFPKGLNPFSGNNIYPFIGSDSGPKFEIHYAPKDYAFPLPAYPPYPPYPHYLSFDPVFAIGAAPGAKPTNGKKKGSNADVPQQSEGEKSSDSSAETSGDGSAESSSIDRRFGNSNARTSSLIDVRTPRPLTETTTKKKK